MRIQPSLAYDPIGPLRCPTSRGSVEACTADMASVMTRLAQESGDGTVTKDDLHRAGFTNGEIDRCHVDAVQLVNRRLRPRQTPRTAHRPDEQHAA